jgi:ABC-type glycerol-3-phosphate transport system substrate-binding protein
LNELIDDSRFGVGGINEKLQTLNSEALNELTYKNTVYGIPFDLDPWGIYVNLDNVNAYNTENPSATIDTNDLGTWSKVMAAAKKLTIKNSGGTVTTAGLNTTSMDGQFFSFAFTAGGEVINTGRGEAEYSSQYGDSVLTTPPDEYGQRARETLAFFLDLYKSDICSNSLGGTGAFVNGTLAMTYGSMFFPQTMKTENPSKQVNYKFIPYPMRDLSYFADGASAPTNTTAGKPVAVDPAQTVGGLKNGVYGGLLGGYGLAIP